MNPRPQGPDGAVALPFLRERLLAVGSLALLAPLPLFFSYSVELGLLALYVVALGLLLRRVRRGRVPRLSNAFLNVAALVYLPLFVFDVRWGSHSLLKATLHLLLFTTVMKLASIRRERDLSMALVLCGFLFVASVGASFHISVLLFVGVFGALSWRVLVRWSLWRDLAAAPEEWLRDPRAREIPGRGPLLLSVTAVLALAVPLFLALPRLRAPYVRGSASGQELTTGFSDSADPDLHAALKRSDRVLARITAERELDEGDAALLRLRTVAFSRWDGKLWTNPDSRGRLFPTAGGGLVPLTGRRGARVDETRALTIDLLPLGSRYVPFPVQGTALRFTDSISRSWSWGHLERDEMRNLRLLREPDGTVRYMAYYGDAPELDLSSGGVDASAAPGSEVLRRIARERTRGLDPSREPAVAARALEEWLRGRSFSYSLDPVPPGPNQVETFLESRRSGHCQAFASAMALLLRELGVPTRFVTGFAGGEIGPFGRYILLRGEHVHAWVEVWCGAEGWVAFDPTPAAGIPTVKRVPIFSRLRQLTDGAEFLFDRFVLGYSQSDQVEMMQRAREAAGAVAEAARDALAAVRGVVRSLAAFGRGAGRFVLPGVALLLLAALALLLRRSLDLYRTTGLSPASAAYRRLQKALAGRGARLTPAAAPGETLAAAASFGPSARAPAEKIVLAYVRESFSGQSDRESNAELLEQWLREFRSSLRVEGVRGNPATGFP